MRGGHGVPMNLTWPSRLNGRLAVWARYCTVSAVSTATGLTVLGLLVGVAGVGATVANVVATAVGTVPSFELNRRWVWAHDGKRSVTGRCCRSWPCRSPAFFLLDRVLFAHRRTADGVRPDLISRRRRGPVGRR